jgi:hypothetical protein
MSSETAAAGITIVARPNGRGRYDALHAGETLVKSTSIPFLAGCRALLARGFDPDAVAVMRHEGSNTDSLRGRIGKAAELAVLEMERGNAPRFIKYRPYEGAVEVRGCPPVAQTAEGLAEGLEAAE